MKTPNTCSRRATLAKILVPVMLATAVASGQTPSRQPTQTKTQTDAPPPPPPPAPAGQTRAVYRAEVNYFALMVTPKDAKGQFVPNLTKDDFQVLEDGVEQKVLDFELTHGGRHFGDVAIRMTDVPSSEGLILPKPRPPADVASRLFIIFIDDLHLTPSSTPQVKTILKQIRNTLIHDNDLVGFVSSGYSSIQLDPAYDYGHRRFDEVINKVMGSGPTIQDMIQMNQGADGLAELNHNVNVAFHTAYDLLDQMESITSLRKAFIWVSSGYSLDPFKDARLRRAQEQYASMGGCDTDPNADPNASDDANNPNRGKCPAQGGGDGTIDSVAASNQSYGMDPFGNPSMEFKPADLINQLAELIRSANRANVVFFPLDPRGLIATLSDASMGTQLTYSDQRDFVESTTSTLRVLAEQTGGIAAVQMNDYTKFLRTIDNMTSDYYTIGYQSSNPDPLHLVRRIEIKMKKPGVKVQPGADYQDVYTLKRPSKAKVKK